MRITFAQRFLKKLAHLPPALQQEAIEKIELFRSEKHHKALGVHKLRGRLKERYSFSVNYKIRIVFSYTAMKPKEACLLSIGDHDVYDT